MIFLKAFELPTLQHVHSGNIFIDNDTCLLGGLESTLLGFPSEIFNNYPQYGHNIDVLIFGMSGFIQRMETLGFQIPYHGSSRASYTTP